MLERLESGLMAPEHLLEYFLFGIFLCQQIVTDQLDSIMSYTKFLTPHR